MAMHKKYGIATLITLPVETKQRGEAKSAQLVSEARTRCQVRRVPSLRNPPTSGGLTDGD